MIASFSRILGLESTPNGIECDDGHFAHLRICPLGIDIEQVDELLSSYMVQNRRDDLLKQYGDKIVIVGVDEMDFTKGIVHKLSAFEVFLQKWPQYRDKVVLVQSI